MSRHYGWPFLLLIALLPSCEDKIDEPKLKKIGANASGGSPGSGGSGGSEAGPSEHQVPPQECTFECCPTDPSCYAAMNPGPGAECLTQRDNTGQSRWQLRQTMSISTKPIGNAPPSPVAAILLLRSQLPSWSTCNEGGGQGGFIQLVDLDLTANIGRVGFAQFLTAAEVDTARTTGLCMVAGTYTDPTGMYQLTADQMTPSADYPHGLPPPMALGSAPWTYGPTKAYRVMDADFDLKAPGNNYPTQREEYLARLAPDGDLGMQGYTGIFYLDQAKGYTHGYSPISYIVAYDTATQYNVVPIREPELTAQLNDPEHPNCVGVYGQYINQAGSCTSTVDNPAWGCANNECPKGQGPNLTHGYFLITEMEQAWQPTLMQTLCVAYQGGTAATDAGWNVNGTCRGSTKWDPANPDGSGIPQGDWCAATNSPAHDTCHDAWENVSYATFQGFNIQENTCPAVSGDAGP